MYPREREGIERGMRACDSEDVQSMRRWNEHGKDQSINGGRPSAYYKMTPLVLQHHLGCFQSEVRARLATFRSICLTCGDVQHSIVSGVPFACNLKVTQLNELT